MYDYMFALLDIIRSVLRGTPVSDDVISKLDDKSFFDNLCKLAKFHDMIHFVSYYIINNKLIDEKDERHTYLTNKLMPVIYRYSLFEDACAKTYAVFEENGIDFIPLKGAVIKKLYPDQWMRTGCDVDICVKQEQLDKAISVLRDKLGYRIGILGDHDIPVYFKDEFHIELHFRLADRDSRFKDTLNSVWDYAVVEEGFAHKYKLKDDMFFFYHVAHMTKHMKNGGCGIRPFIDLYLLNHSRLDTESAQPLLEKNGLLKFEKTASSLAEEWMTGDYTDENTALCEYIMYGGVYGTVKNNMAAKSVWQDIFRFSRIFISYDELKYNYKPLLKHRWLYPFFIVVRIFRLLFHTLPMIMLRRIRFTNRKQNKKTVSVIKDLGL